ncbi:hypothetical protein PVAP13_7KG108710 [Panicum virgatum]|uniref:Uncharacterized protein n=1 Tax=Panicum virgatum TaxID=38727 RepID=A0A8T0QL66_PANVG|nr:hypothetical protein PVAP13_7KG108710 [Panicum virgatum]
MTRHCIRDPTLRPLLIPALAAGVDQELGMQICPFTAASLAVLDTSGGPTPVSGTFLSHSLPPLLSSHLRSRSTHVQTIDGASRGKGQQLARHSGGYLAMEWSSKLLVLLPGRAGVVGIGAHAARGAAPPRTRSWVCVSCRSLALASNQLFGYRSGEEIVLTPTD